MDLREGQIVTGPILLTKTKAKKFASLMRSQSAFQEVRKPYPTCWCSSRKTRLSPSC